MTTTTSDAVQALTWHADDTIQVDVREMEAWIASQQRQASAKHSRLGYRIISVDDLDAEEVRKRASSKRSQTQAILVALASVALCALAVTIPWAAGVGILVLALLLIPAVRQWLDREITSAAYTRAITAMMHEAQRAVRTRHKVASQPLVINGVPSVLSYDRGAYYLTDPTSAALIDEFSASSVRTAQVEIIERHHKDAAGNIRTQTFARVALQRRSTRLPLLDLDFGEDVDAARTWSARLLATADIERDRKRRALLQAVEHGIEHRHHHQHEHVQCYEWISCGYCGDRFHAERERCPHCGAAASG